MEQKSVLYLILVFLSSVSLSKCAGTPAMFIFGDSLIDNGNNNYIASTARANYLPYGIDLGGIPTGRFSNGLTVTDFGARWLGLPYPPPFLSLESMTRRILKGVNYASASAGILDETGTHYGARLSFNGQIELFSKTVKMQLPILMPDPGAVSDYLASSVFIINVGGNDYINNYLLPLFYNSSTTYSPNDFAKLLVQNLAQQLRRLYGLGARKMAVAGLGPLGCIPSQLARNNSTNGECIETVNKMASLFNQHLMPLTTRLNSTLPGSFLVYQNIYDTFYSMIQNPSGYGFNVKDQACCGSGSFRGEVNCMPMQSPCSARKRFIFWDPFHPTEAVNAIIAQRCYSPLATDCYPISIYELAQI